MGLDILVCKPCKKNESEDFTICPNVVKMFPEWVTIEYEEYYDFSNLIPNYDKDTYWDTHDLYPVYDEDGNRINYLDIHNKEGNQIFHFSSNEVPIIRNPVKAVHYKEIGYQRKGANNKFYEDGIWESENYCAVTQKELDEHKEKYFTKNTPESNGGWGSSVEYELTDEEMKKRFEENIYSKFKEGENFVLYA